MAATAGTDAANTFNFLTPKSCPSVLSVKPETSSRRKDVHVPFPNTQELSVFLIFELWRTCNFCKDRMQSKYHVCCGKWVFLELKGTWSCTPKVSGGRADTAKPQVIRWTEGHLGCLTYGSVNVYQKTGAISPKHKSDYKHSPEDTFPETLRNWTGSLWNVEYWSSM